jgi:hypothetical protein
MYLPLLACSLVCNLTYICRMLSYFVNVEQFIPTFVLYVPMFTREVIGKYVQLFLFFISLLRPTNVSIYLCKNVSTTNVYEGENYTYVQMLTH